MGVKKRTSAVADGAAAGDDPDVDVKDLATVRELVKLMVGNGLTEIKIVNRGSKIHLRKSEPKKEIVQLAAPAVSAAAHPVHAAPSAAPAAAESKAPAVAPDSGRRIKSPMVGTFYRSSAPDADPYVEVGGKVSKDTVVCIIEAMKVMNEIKAGVSGTIREVLVENGQPVEFDQPLFVVE